MSHLDSCVDAEGATEGVSSSNFGYGCLGDVFVIQERGEDAREEGVVAVIRDRALARKEINEKVSTGKQGIQIQ